MKPAVSRSGAIWLWHAVGALGARRLAWAFCTGALAAGCGIGLLATSGWLITRASLRPPVLSLSVAIGAVQAFALCRGIARYAQRLAVHDVTLSTLGKLRLLVYDTLEPLVPGGLGSNRSGSLLSAFVTDCDATVDAFAKALGASIDILSSATLGLVLAWLLDPGACAALVGGMVLVVLGALGTGRLGRSAAAAETEVRSELADSVVETVRSAPELLVYGRRDLVIAQLERVRARTWSVAARRAMAIGFGRAIVTCSSAATLIAVVALGLSDHDAHRLSAVLLAVLAFDALAVLDVANTLPDTLAGLAKGDAAAARLRALRTLEPTGEKMDVVSPATSTWPGAEGPVLRGVALEGATVIGRDGAVLLDAVSIRAEAQQRLALVGGSGAGKTSAIYALLGFLDCSRGSATVDGVDVRSLSRLALARRIGWLPEETHVFARTLGANLRVADPSATDEECTEVLDNVGLGALVHCLPAGLGTHLGPGGRVLSAGERQRLGMARALLARGSVMLLDEPTAHLDAASATRLLPELLELSGHRAVLVTSHDAGISRHVDDVVSLVEGRVDGGISRTGDIRGAHQCVGRDPDPLPEDAMLSTHRL